MNATRTRCATTWWDRDELGVFLDEAVGTLFTGARFDTWDSAGTRHEDRHCFTAADVVAVTFLSVAVPPQAAVQLLDSRAPVFAALWRSSARTGTLWGRLHRGMPTGPGLGCGAS